MGSSVSKAAGLHLWLKICSWTSKCLTFLHQPRMHRPTLETEAVFREVVNTDGKVYMARIALQKTDQGQPGSDWVLSQVEWLSIKFEWGRDLDLMLSQDSEFQPNSQLQLSTMDLSWKKIINNKSFDNTSPYCKSALSCSRHEATRRLRQSFHY